MVERKRKEKRRAESIRERYAKRVEERKEMVAKRRSAPTSLNSQPSYVGGKKKR